MLRLLFVCMFLAATLLARAEAPEPVSGVVTRIEIEGNKRIEDASVLAVLSLRRGDVLNSTKVRRDLKAVYGTGFFDDVIVETREDTGGVVLVFRVVEKPAVRDVRVEGNKKVEKEDLDEVIDIRAFTVLSEAEVKRNADRIRDVYVDKGYYLVDVEPEVIPVTEDQVELVFKVTENKKVVIQQVDITGNENVATSKIKRYLQTKEGGVVPWLTSKGTFKQDDLDRDVETLRYLFLEEGYVDAQVSAPKVYLSPDKRFIFISIAVDEGPRYTVRSLDVTGDFRPEEGLSRETALEVVRGRLVSDVQDQQWREATGRPASKIELGARGPHLDEGDVFKLSTLQQVVQALTDLYSDKGYAFVNVVPLPYTDPETQLVDIGFDIDTGEKVRIGKIHITGNDPTFDKVVRREILINEGDLYQGSLIRASRQRLERLGYFESVQISTPKGEGKNVLDMNVKVAEQPTGSFSAGLGYSNLERLVLTGNVSKNNFLGLGYVMSAAINWSRLRKQWNASLFDPYFLDTRWTLKIDGYNITRQFQLNEYQRGGTLEIGRYLDRADDIRMTLGYTLEDVGLTSLDADRQRMLGGDLYRNGLTSSLGVTLNVDKRNNRLFPTKGFYLSAAAELAGGFRVNDEQVLSVLGGDFNFYELRGNLRVYYPLYEKREDLFVFRMNSTLGRTASTDGRVIPFIHRYRAGGINSVRGYNWFSLGPTIRYPSGDPAHADDTLIVGGTETWINNFEIQSTLVRSAGIATVVFFDAGNAFGDPWDQGHLSISGLRFAYGAGVRWQSPIGPLRFEYGIPINPQEGERKGVFDFSIGSFF